MKKLLNWVLLAVLMLAVGAPMVSCDDDDEPQYPAVTQDKLQGTWSRGDDDKSYVFAIVTNPEDKKLMTGARWIDVEQTGIVAVKTLRFEEDAVTVRTTANASATGTYSLANGVITLNVGEVVDGQFNIQFRGMDVNNIGISFNTMGTIKERAYAEDGKTQIEVAVAEVPVKVTVHYDHK